MSADSFKGIGVIVENIENKTLDQALLSNKLRYLDFDDLLILMSLLEGRTVGATAARMGLTQPAVTQRMRKIERVFGEEMIRKEGRNIRLTERGKVICEKAAEVVSMMQTVIPFDVGVDGPMTKL